MENIEIQEEQLSQEPQAPLQQDPPSKKLWQGLVEDKLYSKSFEEFQKQYSNKDALDRLHSGLLEDKLYSKSRDEFENQYFPELKKKAKEVSIPSSKEPSVGVSDGTISTPKPKQVFDWEKDLLSDKYFNKPNRTDATYLAKPLTGEKIEQAERGRANMNLAIENTTERALKAKGIKTPKNSPTYLKQKKKIEDAVKNEDAAYTIDPITKQPALSQTTGFFESMWNGFKSAINDESESDDFVNKMTTKERVDYANKKLSEIEITEDGFIGKKPSAIGRVGEIVGGVAPFAAKATAGAMAGAGLVAAAPETAGASLAGLPTVMSFAFTTPDMINQGAKNEVLRRYSILKQQNPNSPDEFIMRQAEKGLTSGGITGAVTNLAFTGIGAKPLTQIGSKAISNEAKLTIGKYVGNILKSGAHLGTIVSGTEAAKEIEAGIEDKRLRLSPSQIAENATNNFVDNATVGVVLHTLTTLPQLPGAIKSTLKWSLKNENPADLTQILKTNEDIGNIPKGTAEKVMSDINGYNEALKKTSDDLTPEAQASVAGLIQKRDKLKAEMATKDETQVESYNEQIKSLDEQIKEITKTNNPFEFEVNEVGEKINGEIKPAPLQKGVEGKIEIPERPKEKGEPEVISKPIELSLEPVKVGEEVPQAELPVAEEKPTLTAIEQEETIKQMKPFTDRMVEIERDFKNEGFEIDTDYDNEIVVTDKNGEIVDAEELPNNLKKLAGDYEKATMKLGEFDASAREKALAESRKVTEVEAEVIESKKLELPSERENWTQDDYKKELKRLEKEDAKGNADKIKQLQTELGAKLIADLKKSKEQKQVKKEKVTKEESRTQEALNKYEEGEGTFNDLVDEVEAIALDENNQNLKDAVDAYREEQRLDIELKGRGDMDAAESVFMRQIKSELPPTPEKVTPKVEEEITPKLNKDTKTEYTTKSGKQKINKVNGELVVTDAKTGKRVSKPTERKAIKEWEESFDFSKGEMAPEFREDYIGTSPEKAYSEHVINTSENPLEIAQVFIAEEYEPVNLSTTESLIAEFGIGKTTNKSFQRFGDRNLITLSLARAYLNNQKGKSIDVIAKEMSDHYGYEITPQDIVDFMVKFPNGVKDALKMSETEVAQSAYAKFKKLTGLDLTRPLAERLIQKEFDKLSSEQQKITNEDYETAKQLEDEYWKSYEETNGFTKESVSGEAKPAIEAKPKEPTAEKVEPKTELPKEEKIGKFEEQARKIAEKISKAELPKFLQTPEFLKDVKTKGLTAEELQKKLANAVIEMGKLLDKGVEYSKALKEAVSELVGISGEASRENVEKGFDEYYKGLTKEEVPEGLITKEELSKYEEAKKLFESEGKTTWNEVVGKATERLIKDNPNRTVEESAQNHANKLASLYDKGEAINPTAEDLAIINIAKLNVEKKISELEGWDSQDAAEREATMIEFDKLNADLLNIAKAANPREAGLAFNIRQMVLSMGNDGLKMRRMELMKQKGGEPLSESDLNFTREQWAKEKALIEKKSELEKQALQDRFDAEIKAERDKYQKLLEQREKLKGAKLEIKNRQEALKQKGKDFADKLRKGAIKGTYSDPFLIGQSLNFVINRVADIVESGFTLAAAIDKYVAENKIESRRQKVEDAIFDHLSRQDKREKAIELINKQIADTNSKTITKEMVDNNSIKDFVDSYVNTVDVNQVSDVAFKKLKELLPDLNKEDFKKAYLKEGNYKKVTSTQLKNEATNQQKIFNRLTSLQNKLGELKKTGDLLKEGSSKKEQINDEIKKLNDAIQKELISMGKKISSKSALAKEGYEKRASEHNKNIDEVSNEILEDSKLYELSDAEKQYLDNMLGKLKDSKIEYDPQSKLDQSSNVEKATEKIDLLQKQLDKTKKSINKDLAYDIDLGLQKIKDRYESTKKEADQSIMLEQAKQNAINKKKELERKLAAKEFDDTPSKKVLTKSDTELAKVNADLNLVKSAYDKKAEEYRKANRSAGQVILETLRSVGVNTLIGMPKTFAKLTFASPLKIAQTYLSKLTFGRISEKVFNEGLIQSAKEGGESSSTLSANTGLKAVFKNANSKQLEAQSEKNATKYVKSATNYEFALKNLERTKSEYGETSPEYIKEKKKVDKIKAKSDKDLLISVGDTLYQYIGGSTLKTALEKLKSRNTEYERSLGEFGSESWTKVKKWSDVADNVSYIFGYIGRSHGALKSISARYHVATGFMARLEAALAKGEDITNFNKLQEMAADSYADWESGMYQQENWVTTKGNKIVDDFIKSDKRAARIVGQLLSWDVAITKVPVNIINEAVVEMALGLPLSIGKYTKEYQKAKRVVSAEMPKLTSKEKEKYPSQAYSKEEYRKALAEEMSKIDKKTAATIVRMFRHGGFGLGMLGLALAINAQYGGAHHKGEKKEDEKKGEGELKTGEISVGNTKLNKYFAASLDHTSGVFPFLAYQNMLINYKKAMDKDKGEAASITEATVKQLEHIIETYPQAKVVNPITIGKEAYRSYKGAVERAGQEYLGIEPEKEEKKSKKKKKSIKEKKKKKSE